MNVRRGASFAQTSVSLIAEHIGPLCVAGRSNVLQPSRFCSAWSRQRSLLKLRCSAWRPTVIHQLCQHTKKGGGKRGAAGIEPSRAHRAPRDLSQNSRISPSLSENHTPRPSSQESSQSRCGSCGYKVPFNQNISRTARLTAWTRLPARSRAAAGRPPAAPPAGP